MAKVGTYLIIGIGRFGRGFFRRLLKEGVPPKNIYLVDDQKDNILVASNEGIDNVFVASVNVIEDIDDIIPYDYIDNIVIGTSDLETSVSIVSSILERDDYKKKKIYVKSKNQIHSLILKTLGIPSANIFIPEEEIGSRIALRSLFDSNIEVFDLGENFSLFVVEFMATNLLQDTILEMVKKWDRLYGNRKWNIILITGIDNQQRFPNHNSKIAIGERITFCTVKNERKKIYHFFGKEK